MGENMENFLDKIWYTYKARIRTSERLDLNNTHSQVLLVWYVLISTALSIVTIRFPQILGPNTDMSSAIMSVALLIVSLLVANADFRGRSIELRNNYLELQHLYNSLKAQVSLIVPTDEILKQYSHLLNDCENHTELDDKYWRVMLPSTESSKITRKPSCGEVATVYAYIVSKTLLLTTLYLLPLIIGLALFFNK